MTGVFWPYDTNGRDNCVNATSVMIRKSKNIVCSPCPSGLHHRDAFGQGPRFIAATCDDKTIGRKREGRRGGRKPKQSEPSQTQLRTGKLEDDKWVVFAKEPVKLVKRPGRCRIVHNWNFKPPYLPCLLIDFCSLKTFGNSKKITILACKITTIATYSSRVIGP